LWVIVGTLAGIWPARMTVPDAPSQPAGRAELLRQILQQTRVRALFAACFAMSAAHGALYVFYSIHLSDHHYSTFLVGSLWSLGVLAEIVVFFFMVPLLHRFGLRTRPAAQFCRRRAALPDDRQLVDWPVADGLGATPARADLRRLPRGGNRGRQSLVSRSLPDARPGAVLDRFLWCRRPARQSAQWLDLGRLGRRATFALSSAFALVGMFLVARWVDRTDLDGSGVADPLRVTDGSHS
jgi:PPP family 3-phenylpropionic acid transporter